MKEMIKKVRERREGFTMAELLIVVAIIAVLVAIAIPVFTAQLERSRESADLANMRAVYAEVSAQALEETPATFTSTALGGTSVEWNDAAKTFTVDVPMTQKNANWETANASAKIGPKAVSNDMCTDTLISGKKYTLVYTVTNGSVTINGK